MPVVGKRVRMVGQVVGTIVLVLVLATLGCKAMIDRAFPTKDASSRDVAAIEAHRDVLEREGDRLLGEAGIPPEGSDRMCAPGTESIPTAAADPELRAALDDLGVTRRFVSYCTAVFLVDGAAGFGADHPHAYLYRGTELYDPDRTCEGLMGASSMAAALVGDWSVGFVYDC